MTSITAIADDLTGAAEIAGIGLRHGLHVEFVPDSAALTTLPTASLVVINTDSRGLPPTDAATRVGTIASRLAGRVYKKIDSVMRGPVLAEIEAALEAMPRYRRARVVSQNPSRGRTVDADGTYRINGVPLDQTTFARDPDHPRTTANAFAMLGPSDRAMIGPATTLDEVQRHAASLGDEVLPVGGADFFEAILERLPAEIGRTRAATVSDARSQVVRARSTLARRHLFVSGTADSRTRETLVARVPNAAKLPIAWCSAEPPSSQAIIDWASPLRAPSVAALLAPTERGEPSRVQQLLCDAAAALIDAPLALYVDGGATAMALCRRMNWSAMDVVAEIGPGAVTLAPAPGIEMSIKPGSYPWPDAVWAALRA